MSGRTIRENEGKAVAERRIAGGSRVHFEAMVAVGGAESGAGFEAESVDVSSDGMRFRTAYLPTVGDQLVCRFDGAAGEVIALGEVVWTTEQTRGGEFAVRFVDIDEETQAQLRDLCRVEEGDEPDPDAGETHQKALGSRVRLHIEGLGSPMKARVRDADARQMAVGSNLEFLKLGRSVEIEDVDQGERKECFVDGVRVEVDPQTSVPQLVVSLRFDAAQLVAGLALQKTELAEPSPAEPSARIAKEIAPKTRSPKTLRADWERSEPKAGAVKSEAGAKGVAEAKDAAGDEDQEGEEDLEPEALGVKNPKLREVGAKATEIGGRAIAAVGPALASVGRGAQRSFGKLRDVIAKRKEERAQRRKESGPRRVTAPPPSGILTSSGRRVVRDQEVDESSEQEAPRPRSKRGIAMGAGAGLIVLLSVFGIARAVGGDDAAPAPVAAGPQGAPPPALPPIPGAALTADVPLFGATPMSTTEQVPVEAPAPSSAAAAAEPSEEEAPAAEEKKLVRQFGDGEVENPRVLKIRMDGPIEGFSATEVEGGFDIVVPGRKSLSTSSSLVRKDKRLSALDVISREDATTISVRFKDQAPAYLAKVRSDRVEIALSGDAKGAKEKKTVAKKNDKKSTKKASKKGDKKKP